MANSRADAGKIQNKTEHVLVQERKKSANAPPKHGAHHRELVWKSCQWLKLEQFEKNSK